MQTLRLGTRGSQLALRQAHATKALLESGGDVACEIVVIRTSGDRLSEANLAEIGGKRLFVKEIEDALLDGAVDLAVHSSKDMPAVLPEGLAIGAVLAREDARDAVVLPAASGPAGASVEEVAAHLGRAPRIGTSSVRRVAQLVRLFPGAAFLPIRGNLDTRLRKLDAGDFDALVLAVAGLRRLDRGDRVSAALPPSACVPAPGQGIIALEVRRGDDRVLRLAARVDDPDAAAALAAERAVVRCLGGGCQMPIGAHATTREGRMQVAGIVISLDGARAVRGEAEGAAADADALGARVAARLLEQGAAALLEDVHRAQGAVEGLQP